MKTFVIFNQLLNNINKLLQFGLFILCATKLPLSMTFDTRKVNSLTIKKQSLNLRESENFYILLISIFEVKFVSIRYTKITRNNTE